MMRINVLKPQPPVPRIPSSEEFAALCYTLVGLGVLGALVAATVFVVVTVKQRRRTTANVQRWAIITVFVGTVGAAAGSLVVRLA
ncbi:MULTISPECIES: hypothetical protein [unclassified Cryobacterium]|uniref:hypothetical protein n=1 Tax=unclassified Cryobacterium TaxID=2649013 RepID=UPI002AB4328D|nr:MULTISPECIES: hypothetical protein [unclassified Cryobacterium]MDY7544568.1 hypothetical protein [Cryobacterium sp. 5B3]MEB0000117.1 hypothetical protein [Cryobacterium sp. RTS3]MEB0267418.1 hypothetical protein [Cryobacterium sp. 10I5]MEB0275129.1 hypothetical protein [Cryobacterium sp. 5B3]